MTKGKWSNTYSYGWDIHLGWNCRVGVQSERASGVHWWGIRVTIGLKVVCRMKRERELRAEGCPFIGHAQCCLAWRALIGWPLPCPFWPPFWASVGDPQKLLEASRTSREVPRCSCCNYRTGICLPRSYRDPPWKACFCLRPRGLSILMHSCSSYVMGWNVREGCANERDFIKKQFWAGFYPPEKKFEFWSPAKRSLEIES